MATRRQDRMRLDEARAIIRNAEAGSLDLSAPEVLAEVERAQQTVTRNWIRGGASGRWSARGVVILVGALAVLLWVAGLLVAVLLDGR